MSGALHHRCPGPHCQAMVPPSQVACDTHWQQVPKSLRDRVERERKKRAHSSAHLVACNHAIEHMRPLVAEGV